MVHEGKITVKSTKRNNRLKRDENRVGKKEAKRIMEFRSKKERVDHLEGKKRTGVLPHKLDDFNRSSASHPRRQSMDHGGLQTPRLGFW